MVALPAHAPVLTIRIFVVNINLFGSVFSAKIMKRQDKGSSKSDTSASDSDVSANLKSLPEGVTGEMMKSTATPKAQDKLKVRYLLRSVHMCRQRDFKKMSETRQSSNGKPQEAYRPRHNLSMVAAPPKVVTPPPSKVGTQPPPPIQGRYPSPHPR